MAARRERHKRSPASRLTGLSIVTTDTAIGRRRSVAARPWRAPRRLRPVEGFWAAPGPGSDQLV